MEVETDIEMTENESLVKDIRSHYILHWNYRGYRKIPHELLKHGSHIEDLYFKENGLQQLPGNLICLLGTINMNERERWLNINTNVTTNF